jgi:hypothetical protein
MDDWKFYQHRDQKWSWRSLTASAAKESVGQFESFIQAMGDALRHGFEPGISKVTAIQAERRCKPR